MRFALAAAALSLAGCATSTRLPADVQATFDPVAYFTGRSHGDATLRKVLGGAERVTVSSSGRSDGRGGLILDQTVREGNKAPRQRQWVLRPAGLNHYSGTLTDATGPVDVTVSGPRATIRYRMKGGLDVEQQLALQSDRRTVLNQLRVSKLGIHIAQLDETIRKLD